MRYEANGRASDILEGLESVRRQFLHIVAMVWCLPWSGKTDGNVARDHEVKASFRPLRVGLISQSQ